MTRILLLGVISIAISFGGISQNVFDPNDPIIRYDKTKPYGSAQYPDTTVIGLQKWVSVPSPGVSYGTDSYDASSFKQYFLNTGSSKVAFRIKFPKSFNNPDSLGKKYPINLFLHGGGEVGCATNGGIYNNERPIWLGGKLFMDMVDNNQFDGFLVYPQFVVYDGCFAGWLLAPGNVFNTIVAMLDSMGKYVRADIDRVVVTGLSGGGYGAWRFAQSHPRRITKIMPSAAQGVSSNRQAFVHIPIWFATGGKDPDPSPEAAQLAYTKMKELGANIRYTMYPNKGHSMWYNHWREPDFIPEMNDMHKANPLVFFQRDAFCIESNVNAKLGITLGFYAYEWQKDGETIATYSNGSSAIVNGESIINYSTDGNEITVRKYGTYRVRFKRSATAEWSDWSHKPAVIKTKGTTQAAPIQVVGNRSKVLPALDGSTTVPLTMPDGFLNYEWFDATTNTKIDSNQLHEAGIGTYKTRYEEEYGCGTEFSPLFHVIDANGTPKPGAATNLSSTALGESVIRLNWTDGTGETGFEVYRATATGGPYTFVKLTNANVTTFTDSNLNKNTIYYYVIRAVSETGASVASNETSAKTLLDNVAPTTPSDLQITGATVNTADIAWSASTDNIGVDHYDIYVNGNKLYSTTDTLFTVTQLDSLIPYRFVVRAIDSSGNVSPASNQVTFLPPGVPGGSIPETPSGLTVESSSYNTISLQWSDDSNNETGFEIFRSETEDGPYVTIATIDSSKTSFTDSALAASTEYFYKVRAIGESGESDYSNTVNATTAALPNTPIAPTQVTGTPGDNNTVAISWLDNANNETKYIIYRSTDSTDFTAIGEVPANSNSFTDTDATAPNIYYYYVVGENNNGAGSPSKTIKVRTGNNAPVINVQTSISVKVNTTVKVDFNVSDQDQGDTLRVSVTSKPAFVQIIPLGDNQYEIKASPLVQHVGSHVFTITATDNDDLATSVNVQIIVSDNNTNTVYINFGSNDMPASAPWNNWLGSKNPGDVLENIVDERDSATAIKVTAISAWSGTQNMGHITGSNSGVFPDDALRSGLTDGGTEKLISVSGLNTTKQYNLVFVGSRNEGIDAQATYSCNGQSVTLNSRYNTNFTANLNNLIPDVNGQLLVTINRVAGSPMLYLNAFAIEELSETTPLLNPNNVYADALDRNKILITWSDRTNHENETQGYELSRATDSLFTEDNVVLLLPANTTTYTDTTLIPNTKYWYRVRARNDAAYSGYSKVVNAVTPQTIVYVNFNVTVEGAPTPWNNLESGPMFNFTTPPLNNQSGQATNMSLTLVSEFNGEFTAGVITGNNSGVVPDNVLAANYWLDREQLSQLRLNGLNHSKQYRIGFIGSSSLPWFRENYTAMYTVKNRSVYLNSWENSTKIVYIDNISPENDGTLMLNFSTTKEAGYGFNAGVIIEEYDNLRIDGPPVVDTIPGQPPIVDPEDPDNPDNPGNPGGPDPDPDTTGVTPPTDSVKVSLKVFPNPVTRHFRVAYYNSSQSANIDIEIFDSQGRRTFIRRYGQRPIGNNTFELDSYEARMRSGVYFVTLKLDGKTVKTIKVVKNRL